MSKIHLLIYVIILNLIHTNSEAIYHSQIGQDKKIHEILGNKKNGIFIDIGAHDGITYSNTYFFEKELGWHGICIEPLPDVFNQLIKNRTCICIKGCVSNFDGEVEFLKITNISEHGPEMLSGIISTYDPRHLKRIEKELALDGGTKEIIKVPCFLLNTILEKYKIYHVDYLTIDTEGSELSILEKIDFDRFYIDIIDVENAYNERIVRNFLESKGFVFCEAIGFDDLYRNKNVTKIEYFPHIRIRI